MRILVTFMSGGRGGRWRIRLDPVHAQPERAAAVLPSWPDAQMSAAGEISIPEGPAGAEAAEVLRLLEAIGEESEAVKR